MGQRGQSRVLERAVWLPHGEGSGRSRVEARGMGGGAPATVRMTDGESLTEAATAVPRARGRGGGFQ